MSSQPCVLVVADPGRIAELATALGDPFPQGPVDVLVSTGGDDTIDLFESRAPRVVVLTASLELGDAKSLIETLRDMVAREQLSIVLIGDEVGPIRNALDAIDLKPDRFVSRPLATKALRFAVQSGLEMVARALGEPGTPAPATPDDDGVPTVSRTPTSPLRGGAPAPNGADAGGTGSGPAGRNGQPHASDPEHDANAPLVTRVKTDRGTGIRGIADSDIASANTGSGTPAGLAVGRSPTDRGIGIANATPGLQLEEDLDDAAEQSKRAALRARWEALADSIGDDALADDAEDAEDAPEPSRSDDSGRHTAPRMAQADDSGRHTAPRGAHSDESGRHTAPRMAQADESGRHTAPRMAQADESGRHTVPRVAQRSDEPRVAQRSDDATGAGSRSAHDVNDALRAHAHGRGLDALGLDADDETLRDDVLGAALSDSDFSALSDEAAPLPPPIEIGPRRKGSTNPDFHPVPPLAPWRPGTTSEMREEPELASPAREPTLILHGDEPPSHPVNGGAPGASYISGADTAGTGSGVGATSATGSTEAGGHGGATDPSASGTAAEPARAAERWSHPVLLSELIDRSRDSSRELLANIGGADDLGELDEIDDDIIVGNPGHTHPPHILRGGKLEALEDLVEPEFPAEPPPRVPSTAAAPSSAPDPAAAAPSGERPGGRDFARQLRAKMSMMAQRLFQSDSPAQPSVDVRPRHDHHTEIDLVALGEEPALVEGVTQIESRARGHADAREMTATSPGSWDTQVREKGLPDSGEIVRGVSDAAMVLARMFVQSFTGRVGFRKDDVEKVAYFDQGRPVFASSNEPGDRMGELLVREGKITASQYERCQAHVAQSGRRMGEILVDFGYLKRRELLPAVRRHVEDILYSLFGWDRGHYHVTADPAPSAERIRLSRHPASLILEGIRRKLGRSTLEKVLGPASTVIEIPDKERIAAVINAGDLAQDERASLAAFDGQADLAQVARVSGVDVADVLPLAWGLVVLGLATARRAEADPMEESTALVGETDLAIDRERVHARWELVSEADYFALLGVRRDATAFEIRRAYQSARRDFAADCFPTDLRRELARELEDIASVLDEAFRVLRDDRLRQTYLANLLE